MNKRESQICINCVMDTTDSKITFNNEGMCDHCQHFYGNIKPKWIVNENSKEKLENIVAKIKKKNKKENIDCIIDYLVEWIAHIYYTAKECYGQDP